MNQPILDRPMFQGIAPTVSPMGSPMGGVGSITTPDQNAVALRNMFAPQPSAQPAPQGYRRGGEIINGVAHFAGGDEVVAQEVPAYAREGYDPTSAEATQKYLGETPIGSTPVDRSRARREAADKAYQQQGTSTSLRNTAQDTATTSPQGAAGMRMMEEGRLRNDQNMVRQGAALLEGGTTQAYDTAGATPRGEPLRRAAQEVIATPPAAGIPSLIPSDTTIKSMQDTYSNPNPANLPPPSMGGTPLASPVAAPASPLPALPPVPDGTELQLQSIKARREQSEKDREQNKWMGILSAGLGMMASKDPRGIVGIGTGAQQGLATFQAAEKGRREDEATRRHEDIQKQQLAQQKQISDAQLAQQKTLTMAQIEKDPDNVRLFRALGGGDLQKGLNMYQADGKLQAAKAIMDNFMSTAEAKRDAEAYIRSALQRSGTAASGSAPGAPPPGSPVVSASDFLAGKK